MDLQQASSSEPRKAQGNFLYLARVLAISAAFQFVGTNFHPTSDNEIYALILKYCTWPCRRPEKDMYLLSNLWLPAVSHCFYASSAGKIGPN